jgi:serine-type D-Ala-D-Ala carboxypeptidase/endopeptidase
MPLVRPTLLTLLVPALLPLLPAAGAAQDLPSDAEIAALLRVAQESSAAPGIVVALLEGDGPARVLSDGTVGPGGAPVGRETRFEIGSLVKPFIAALLLEMVERGEVRLDDPVARHLPPHVRVPSLGGREITLEDLATHRSGLPVWHDRGPQARMTALEDFTVEELYAWLGEHRLRLPPGAGYAYSNLGYGLLGHTLAQAAGVPLADLLRERILEPLGLTATSIPAPGSARSDMARPHRRGEPAHYWAPTEALQGAGAMTSNAEDLLVFMRAALSPPRTAAERAVHATMEVRVPDGEGGAGWGMGWRIGRFPDGTLLTGQGGRTDGYRVRLVLDRARAAGLAFLTNDFFFDVPLENLLLGQLPVVARASAPPGGSGTGTESRGQGGGLPLPRAAVLLALLAIAALLAVAVARRLRPRG